MTEDLRPPRPLCVGCAHDLGYETKRCPSCGTAAVGAIFSKRIQCPSPSVYKTPALCCCCLALVEQIDKHEVLPTGGVIQIPWCAQCKDRRFTRGLLAWVGWLGGVGGAYAAGSFLSPGTDPENRYRNRGRRLPVHSGFELRLEAESKSARPCRQMQRICSQFGTQPRNDVQKPEVRRAFLRSKRHACQTRELVACWSPG